MVVIVVRSDDVGVVDLASGSVAPAVCLPAGAGAPGAVLRRVDRRAADADGLGACFARETMVLGGGLVISLNARCALLRRRILVCRGPYKFLRIYFRRDDAAKQIRPLDPNTTSKFCLGEC